MTKPKRVKPVASTHPSEGAPASGDQPPFGVCGKLILIVAFATLLSLGAMTYMRSAKTSESLKLPSSQVENVTEVLEAVTAPSESPQPPTTTTPTKEIHVEVETESDTESETEPPKNPDEEKVSTHLHSSFLESLFNWWYYILSWLIWV